MRSLLFGIALACAACGGNSGGPTRPVGIDDVLLTDLTSSDIQNMCNYTVDIEGGPANITCTDSTMVHVLGFTECVDMVAALTTTCAATAGDYMDCAQAHQVDECDDTSIACQNVFNGDCL